MASLVTLSCGVQIPKGEAQQFSRKLRCIPERRRMEEGSSDRNSEGRFVPSWRSGGGGRGSSGMRSNYGRSRSDAPSSRKSLGVLAIDGEASKKREEVEVTGPLKIQHHNATENVSKHVLCCK